MSDEDDFTHYFNATVRLSRENTRLRAELAALRKAAAPFRSERGYCCDGLPPDCIHDALRKALEGEA